MLLIDRKPSQLLKGRKDFYAEAMNTCYPRWWFKLVVPLVTVICTGLVVELGLHWIPNPYKSLVPWKATGVWHVPNKTYTYHGAFLAQRQPDSVAPNVVRWNSGGWHDVDHELEKAPGTIRVLVLGDSYIEGIQVRLDELYHRQMERLLSTQGLGPVEVIAMGASGWGQAHELDALMTKGLVYRPDLVIAEFLPGNDVRNNNAELERLANEQASHSTFARELFITSVNDGRLLPAIFFDKVDLAVRLAHGQQDSIDSDVYRTDPVQANLWKTAWRRTAQLVADMKAVAHKAGADLVVTMFTSPMEIEALVPGTPAVTNHMDMRLPARKMAEICASSDIACLDLAVRFSRLNRAERNLLHLAGDGHWSREGHRHAALETVKYLAVETAMWQHAQERAASQANL